MIQEPSASLRFTLDIAQIVMIGGLIWGLAKMSAAVDQLRAVTGELTEASKEFSKALTNILSRIAVLESRRDRPNHDRDA